MAEGRLGPNGLHRGFMRDASRGVVDDSGVALQVPDAGTGDLLGEREKTHGNYTNVANIADALRRVMQNSKNWETMTPAQRSVFCMSAEKWGRVGSGDPNFKDHWLDLAGYAMLIARTL